MLDFSLKQMQLDLFKSNRTVLLLLGFYATTLNLILNIYDISVFSAPIPVLVYVYSTGQNITMYRLCSARDWDRNRIAWGNP